MTDKTYTLAELITNLRAAEKRLAASGAPSFQSGGEAIGWTVASMLGYDLDTDRETADAAYKQFDADLTAAGL